MRRKLDSLDQDFVLKNRNDFTTKQISKKLDLSESAIIKYLEQNPVQNAIQPTTNTEQKSPEKTNTAYILDDGKSARGDLYKKSVATEQPDRIHRIK